MKKEKYLSEKKLQEKEDLNFIATRWSGK